jgi:hypothetical protein
MMVGIPISDGCCNLVKITIIVSFLRLLCSFLASHQKWAELELSMYTCHLLLSRRLESFVIPDVSLI